MQIIRIDALKQKEKERGLFFNSRKGLSGKACYVMLFMDMFLQKLITKNILPETLYQKLPVQCHECR